MKIVFMGTPEFAVASLDALLSNNFDVVGVVTAPDKPAGRGLKPKESAVKKFSLEHGLQIMQPEKLKDPEFHDRLRALNADLFVVVAFRMLPEVVWTMPPLGTINVHASLLPRYRGAAPINWAIINGEKESGVTTFSLQHAIDTGNILLQEKVPIGEEETAGELHDRLMKLGADLLVRTVNGLQNNSIQPTPQPIEAPVHAPKIFTETAKIHWEKPVKEIHNLIRGLSPYPGAFTEFRGKMMKIFRANIESKEQVASPGEIITDNKTYLKIAAHNGLINITELQLEGKKRMKTEEFLRGLR